jgi:predicted TIM-barrel fold metal-dependent hydrolase
MTLFGPGGGPIVDSHCHAWRRWPYPPPVPDEESRGSIEQLIYEMDAHSVAQAVVVCAAIEHNPDNVEYVASARERYPSRLHVVADIDCWWSSTYHAPGSAGRLRVLAERYPIAGFTHYVEDRNDGWLRSDEADELFALAAERRLIASIGAGPAWLADLRRLAARHPSVPVLCHILGGARAQDGVDSADLAEVVASAAVPNVYLKVAGLHYTSERPWDYPWLDVIALFARLFDAYGPAKFCWGSDFPASTRFCTFRQSIEAVRTHCTFLTPADLRLVLGQTMLDLLATGQTAG